MAFRIGNCPRVKQITGTKTQVGWPGFASPGFVGTYDDSSDTWTSPSGSPSFNVGDLVLHKGTAHVSGYPSGGTVGGTTYPAVYFAFICIEAVSGTTADPWTDTTHFQKWDFTGTNPSGPTAFPISNTRAIWSSSSDIYTQLTLTTEFDNFPGHWDLETGSEYAENNLNNGTFAWVYDFATHFANMTTTDPATAPDEYQTNFIFPVVPPFWAITGSGNTITQEGYPQPLVSWSFSETEIQFVFAFWAAIDEGVIGEPSYGDSPPTITQTLSLANEYAFSDVMSEAEAALAGTTFAAMAWNTVAACTYNSDGSIAVTTTALASGSAPEGTACVSGAIGGTTATAANGGASVSLTPTWGATYAKALVDVCGNYCLKTFYCQRATPVIDCASGNVSGFAPVEIDPPTFDITQDTNVATYLFPNCTCS